MYQRKRTVSQPMRKSKRQRTSAASLRALVPTYRGFAPRSFALGEWKYNDVNIGGAVSTTATYTLLNGLAPGTSAQTRVGQKIAIRSLQFNLHIAATATNGIDQEVRLTFVVDKQSNGAAPAALTDIYHAAQPHALRNLANRKRFYFLWDKYIGLSGAASGSAGNNMRTFQVYIKFKRPIIVDYNTGVAGTVADISTNAIYFVTNGSVVAGGTDAQATGFARIRFTDM